MFNPDREFRNYKKMSYLWTAMSMQYSSMQLTCLQHRREIPKQKIVNGMLGGVKHDFILGSPSTVPDKLLVVKTDQYLFSLQRMQSDGKGEQKYVHHHLDHLNHCLQDWIHQGKEGCCILLGECPKESSGYYHGSSWDSTV